ncbi:MAG: hypothetical protein ACXWG1_00315 [Usitatibacter sp.]
MISISHGDAPQPHILERTHRLTPVTIAPDLVDMAFEDYADSAPRFEYELILP